MFRWTIRSVTDALHKGHVSFWKMELRLDRWFAKHSWTRTQPIRTAIHAWKRVVQKLKSMTRKPRSRGISLRISVVHSLTGTIMVPHILQLVLVVSDKQAMSFVIQVPRAGFHRGRTPQMLIIGNGSVFCNLVYIGQTASHANNFKQYPTTHIWTA